ncbi:MAG: hypothetical protein J4F42_15010 [Desulfurellaceae bacterium]|nr:hypothetical protein [Desulfurellaceae bacterium]
MSFLLRLCLGLFLLAPSLVYAEFLETPDDGDKLSGIGVIRGWKCEAAGDITVKFDDETQPVSLVYGVERPDTEPRCGDTDNGFVAIYNWALLGDDEHTAVAYDNGVEFARSTFSVATAGVEYLTNAPDTCVTVNDFPSTGETTYLEWNTSTQHFEMVESCKSPEPEPTEPEPADLGECMVGSIVNPGQMCSGTILSIDFTFSVEADGRGCVESLVLNRCYDTSLSEFGAAASRNDDDSWTITALP